MTHTKESLLAMFLSDIIDFATFVNRLRILVGDDKKVHRFLMSNVKGESK